MPSLVFILTFFFSLIAGNEYFRGLVKKYKLDYVACPKPQKARYSRLIVDDVYARNGLFLKQDSSTKLWRDIGDKKALDKTRQALREGAPELLKEMEVSMVLVLCPSHYVCIHVCRSWNHPRMS